MNMYEREQIAKKQGFYFAVERALPRWEQFGHQMHATEEQAHEEGKSAVAAGACEGFTVHRCILTSPSLQVAKSDASEVGASKPQTEA